MALFCYIFLFDIWVYVLDFVKSADEYSLRTLVKQN